MLRRMFVTDLLRGGAATFLFMSGCGQGSTVSPTAETSAKPVEITFEENDGFYNKLEEALEASSEVIVKFDGEARVDRDSKMKDYLAKAANSKKVYEKLVSLDNENGRKELSSIFTTEALEHQRVEKALKSPSGEIIEPGTIILVIAFMLIAAGTSVAHAAIYNDQPYEIEMIVPGPSGRPWGGLRFKGNGAH